MSNTADARRRDPAQPVVAGAPSAGMRAPRPWAAPLPRPAARILLAGGLTLAGWLLGAALSNASASADELPTCAQPDTATTHTHHRKHVTEQDACAKRTTADESDTPEGVAPSAEKLNSTKVSSNGLLGGLIGGLADVVGGTLKAVTGAVSEVGQTALAPITAPPAGNPDAAPILPIGDVLEPVLGGSSSSGSVTATVPDASGEAVANTTGAIVTAVVPAPAAPEQAGRATATPHITFIPRHRELPASVVKGPQDSGVHARTGGGDNGPGLPSAPSAPSAPAAGASSGHDGPGGARQPFAVRTDEITTTQLKLAGTNRDHAADGAGREAALPTTSPD